MSCMSDEINTNNGDSSNKYERAVLQTLLELKIDVATQEKEIKTLKQKTQGKGTNLHHKSNN